MLEIEMLQEMSARGIEQPCGKIRVIPHHGMHAGEIMDVGANLGAGTQIHGPTASRGIGQHQITRPEQVRDARPISAFIALRQ
jgi:hypothetical protein